MKIKDFIEKAIEGGWHNVNYPDPDEMRAYGNQEAMFLDLFAWRAVGKVERWDNLGANGSDKGKKMHYGNKCLCDTPELFFMHRMIDALAEGKTIEQYLETL